MGLAFGVVRPYRDLRDQELWAAFFEQLKGLFRLHRLTEKYNITLSLK